LSRRLGVNRAGIGQSLARDADDLITVSAGREKDRQVGENSLDCDDADDAPE